MTTDASRKLNKKISHLKKALKRQPKLYARLADLYIQKGDARAAAATLSQGLSQYPNDLSGWLMKGYFHLWQRQYALAQSAFQRAIQIDVRVPSAYYQLAELAKEEKNWSATAGYLKVLTVLDALDDGVQTMLHTMLMRQVALESGLFKPEEVEMMMPGALRSVLLDKGLLPPELQRRTDRFSLSYSSPTTPSAAELSPPSPQPPVAKGEEGGPRRSLERDKDGSDDLPSAQDFLSERMEENGEEVERISWADAVAGEPSKAVYKVWAEPEPEEEGVPPEVEKDFSLNLEQQVAEHVPEAWDESEPEEIGLLDRELPAPEEDIYPQREVAEEPIEDFSQSLSALEEEEHLPLEEEREEESEEFVGFPYEPSREGYEPPTPPPPHHPPIPIEPTYWAEIPDPAVVHPQDDTPIVRLMKMKREDVQRMIERGEVEDSSTSSHISPRRIPIESPIDSLMGEGFTPSEGKTSLPGEDKKEEKGLSEQPEEPPLTSPPPFSPEVSAVELIKAQKPTISPQEAKKVGEGAKSARGRDIAKSRGVSPGEEIDTEAPEPEVSLPLPSLPPEIQAQQEEARRRLEEVAKQVTSHKKAASPAKSVPPSEKPKIATKTLAELYASQGDWARAIEVYEELLHRFPDNQAYRRRVQELRKRMEGTE